MLPINSEVFKAYDIRGIYGRDFDEELAYLLGLAFVQLRKNDPDCCDGRKLRIAVGADMRLSSQSLKASLLRGLTDAGADAIDIGLAATPVLYFVVGKKDYDGGIVVSASHNPKEWNGFKLVRAKSVPVSGETGIETLKDMILGGKLKPAKIPGSVSLEKETLFMKIPYTMRATSGAVEALKKHPLKIVADPANGMGATYFSEIFKGLPGELIPLNFNLDGTFPAHEADPLKEENLAQLKEAVLKNKADLGIATDGDGDRIFFVDNEGQTIDPAIVRGLLAREFLRVRPGAKIGYDVRPGRVTVDLIKEAGGIPVMTRVGHSLIKEQMIKEDIYFAGESSGHFYLNGEFGCFEYPITITLKFIGAIAASGLSAADYVRPYKKYFHSGEINIEASDKETIFQKLLTAYPAGEASCLDGLSINYPDFWFNVRGSNTEPKLRLNLEATTKETMEKRRDEVLKIMRG